MILDKSISKQINPLTFLGNTTLFLFDSEKRNIRLLDKTIRDSDTCLNNLIRLLESINVNQIDKDSESIEKTLSQLNLLGKLLRTLLEPTKSIVNEAEKVRDPLYYKYRQVYFKNCEVASTIDKIIDKLHDLKDNKLVSDIYNINLSSNTELWSDSEDSELRELFLKS